MDKKKRNYIISGVLISVAILFTILVKFIDVRSVGVNGTDIGFAFINKPISNLIGSNMLIYDITEWLGIIPLLVVMAYGLVGLMQLVKRKNVFKVDKEILILGGFYVVVAVLYVFFEKVIINYRPVLMDGELEASFPSSHTVLAICVCVSAIVMNKFYIKDKSKLKLVNIFIIILMILVVVGRLVSGVHWFSDIMGGIIISGTLLSYYFTLNSLFLKRHE